MHAIDLPKLKSDFIEGELWTLTTRGGLGARGGRNVYRLRPKVPDADKKRFHEFLRCSIKRFVNNSYRNRISTECHIRNIEDLKRNVNQEFGYVLNDQRITLGVVQKLLNLQLKYQWVLGNLPTPPHCPFDAIVIKALGKEKRIKWTEMDTGEEYRELVEAAENARERDGMESIAEWELKVWSQNS